MNKLETECPVCNSKSETIRYLESQALYEELGNHFQSKIIQDLEICDYHLQKCKSCSYEFAYPFIEGSSSFYNWITRFEQYYPGDRWEYHQISQILSQDKPIKLLDVGCGDGTFFDFISKNNLKVDLHGLDTNQFSVDVCHEKGYEKVSCCTINELSKTGVKYDLVCAYHVLEHIADPVQFIKELLTVVKEEGVIYVSTPYSPMDIELEWFDILNHPPHHMGRWSFDSYRALAKTLNLKVEFFMPPAKSVLISAIESLSFSLKGVNFDRSKYKIILTIFKNPIKFLSHLRLQKKRGMFNNRRTSNVVLVKLYSH